MSKTYRALRRGEKTCEVHGSRKHPRTQCREPAAAELDYGGSGPIALCAECYERSRSRGEPTLTEIRMDCGHPERMENQS